MDRRTFLKLAATVPAVSVLSNLPDVISQAYAQQKEFDPRPAIGSPGRSSRGWRSGIRSA